MAYSFRSTPYFFIIRSSLRLFGSHCIKFTFRRSFCSWNRSFRTIVSPVKDNKRPRQRRESLAKNNKTVPLAAAEWSTCLPILSVESFHWKVSRRLLLTHELGEYIKNKGACSKILNDEDLLAAKVTQQRNTSFPPHYLSDGSPS